ncbi:MAG TPA: reverse transcriptase domain-containing protein [Polyangiales bacterium]|nr:reverse transcriptase domain-containing protein [Polyangiales bacterium]
MIPADRGLRSSSDLFARLADPALYVVSAERVRERQLASGQLRPLASDGPWLQGVLNIESFASALAREVGRGAYQFGAVRSRAAMIRGEMRTLYVAPPLDEVVLGALASAFAPWLEHFLSPRVFSYRRGRSALRAVEDWLQYLRAHRGRSSERRTWGLYVLRRDVRGYGDAIASGPDSRLWPLLREALARAGCAPSPAQEVWLKGAFRPPVIDSNGAQALPELGIPTGSALQPTACNVYLTPIDRLLESVPDGFYARYGDDMLFAHPNPERVKAIAVELDRELEALKLSWSGSKCAQLYFNLAGRHPAREHAQFRGASSLDYLGLRVDFHGVIGLKHEKSRQLLRDLSLRLAHTDRLLRGAADSDRARDLCAIANALLDPVHPTANSNAVALRYLVSDRSQLRDLDHQIALRVAQQLSAQRGVRAFRKHSPRMLHMELGLTSLVRARNQVGRRPSPEALAARG